ncbi:unnamed protein product [Chilo suppressalis]|uniref:Alpha-actinin-2 n=1 Tax=Chilo suppressalis TaxID=168631 RepID=A0ABN8B3W4_CHISP|nr:unnamed protein product [Chilo suppressalis]
MMMDNGVITNNYEYGDGYMEQEEEWEREGLLDPAWEKQQKKDINKEPATTGALPDHVCRVNVAAAELEMRLSGKVTRLVALTAKRTLESAFRKEVTVTKTIVAS